MAKITKQHATKIAKKLKAIVEKKKNRAHDIASIYHDGVLIATFGIRRGSNKDLEHGHIPNDLHLSPHDTIELANCPLSRDDWIAKLQAGGWIEEG